MNALSQPGDATSAMRVRSIRDGQEDMAHLRRYSETMGEPFALSSREGPPGAHVRTATHPKIRAPLAQKVKLVESLEIAPEGLVSDPGSENAMARL